MMVETKTAYDRILDALITILMLFLILSIVVPFLNILALSLNDSRDTMRGGITIFPREITWMNYRRVVENPSIVQSYIITIARTVIGTLTSLLCTSLFAYGLSKKWATGRKFYTIFTIIPMYFSGGLIPYFVLINQLGLFDNFLVYIIPNLIGIWNMILLRTSFSNLPASLEESALLDGAGQYKIFFSIIFPLSRPVIATIALFNAVFQFCTIIYPFAKNNLTIHLDSAFIKFVHFFQSISSETIVQHLAAKFRIHGLKGNVDW